VGIPDPCRLCSGTWSGTEKPWLEHVNDVNNTVEDGKNIWITLDTPNSRMEIPMVSRSVPTQKNMSLTQHGIQSFNFNGGSEEPDKQNLGNPAT
jgi:hypothetical protein